MRNLILPLCMLSAAVCMQLSSQAQSDYSEKVAQHLNEHHSELGLTIADVQHFIITDNYVTRHNGVHHIYIAQTVNGLPVMNGTANVTLDRNENVVYVANRLISGLPASTSVKRAPGLTPDQAIYAAADHLDIEYTGTVDLLKSEGPNKYVFSGSGLSLEDIPVELAYWATAESELHLVWNLSIHTLDGKHWWNAIVDATTGELITRFDWVVECESTVHGTFRNAGEQAAFSAPSAPKQTPNSYRVFALPHESPSHGGRTLEVNPADSLASPFGWHDTNGVIGPELTITRGNNAHAYEDTLDNNIPGYSPDGGSSLEFDFPLDLNKGPHTYVDAAVTNLFFTCNRIHDITYHYGFDEEAGNFQVNNYGRGGLGGDDVRAEAQDGGGTNNANFGTPADGGRPRMQMYLWTSGTGLPMTVNTPSSIAGTYQAVGAAFGNPVPTTPLTSDVVLVDDTTGPDPNDGCEPIQNGSDLSGKIAVIIRGSCNFVDKVLAAQNEGAIAVIMVNNIPGSPIVMGGTSGGITIPSVMISNADGQLLINALNNGDTVNVTLQNPGGAVELDGDFDNGVITHEYTHGISNRLTGGPNDANCLNNAEQMGEGWSDWVATMLTMDLSQPNPVNRPMGTYVSGNPPKGDGIRNADYDTSFAVNAFTYGDVNNTLLVSEPHGIGFVWCTMLWDLTWAMMDKYGYDDDLENGTGGDDGVMQLVMDGMKLQPCSPGFVDGRDAILLADQLNNGGANQCLIWKVFARRGLGYSANQGSSFSRSDQTEAFDLPPLCQIPVSAPSANFKADTTETCNGKINFLDLSTNIPQQWKWDFGDGDNSTLQNPTHQYSAAGIYTVKLVVSNTLGADSLVRTSYINFNPPEDPIATAITGCKGDSLMLTGTASGRISWLDAGNNVLDTGSTFQTPPLTATTTYHVVNEYGSPGQNVGPVDENFGTGGYHGSLFIGTVDFTADIALTIVSAYVNAGSPGPRTVSLWDGPSGSGNVVQQVTINPVAGPQRVKLNFEVPGPGNYSIGLNNADLYRNNAGANYPYTIPGVISLTGNAAGPGFYYYFYDLEIKGASCYSDTVAVIATIIDSVDFSYQVSNLDVDFTDMTGATGSWHWDFGDGGSSVDQHPTHTYAANGIYTVTLTIGSCSQSYEVAVGNIGIEQLEIDGITMTIQPNPASDATLLRLSKPFTQDMPFRLMSLDGRLVQTLVLPAGAAQLKIPLSNLPASVYWLVPENGQPGKALKVVVLR